MDGVREHVRRIKLPYLKTQDLLVGALEGLPEAGVPVVLVEAVDPGPEHIPEDVRLAQQSEAGSGATFWSLLPRHRSPSPPSTALKR